MCPRKRPGFSAGVVSVAKALSARLAGTTGLELATSAVTGRSTHSDINESFDFGPLVFAVTTFGNRDPHLLIAVPVAISVVSARVQLSPIRGTSTAPTALKDLPLPQRGMGRRYASF